MSFDNYYPFSALTLPYGLDALNPYVSEYTLYFHHDKHYKNYLDKLNALLKKSPLMQNVPLEALTKTEDADIRTNAGGVYNHELYFTSLTPERTEPSGKMRGLIENCFGSEKELWGELINAGLGVVGSGYVWLVLDTDGKLAILTTPNQETIDFDKFIPIFNIDVWEHAYYLDRQNRRADYIDALKSVINWENAEKRLNGSSS